VQKKLDSAQAIVASLIDHGVDCVFGIPGAHTYKLIDALYERRDRIRFMVTRHEQGAAYMAYGYAKSTGKVGVYTCVPGPGVLNTTAALCTAYAGNAPVLCVTSEIPSKEIGRGHGILHELPDQLNTLRTLTKTALRINHPTEAAAITADAFYHLRSGRPGPVVVECPWDTLGATARSGTAAAGGSRCRAACGATHRASQAADDHGRRRRLRRATRNRGAVAAPAVARRRASQWPWCPGR
jgi:acetolactate synthase-1/2/3 large subunit